MPYGIREFSRGGASFSAQHVTGAEGGIGYSRTACDLPTPAALQEVIDQLRGRVIHLHVEGFNLVGEVVEHHDGGNGDEQSNSRRHQRFRNTACDCAKTRGLLCRNLAERVQNSDHGAEQSDERSGGTDGRETAESAL